MKVKPQFSEVRQIKNIRNFIALGRLSHTIFSSTT